MLDEVKFLSLEAEVAEGRIAVVTHAGVLRTMLCALLGCSEDNAWEQTRSYCSVVRIPARLPVPCRLLRQGLEFIEG